MALLHQILKKRCRSCPDSEIKRWVLPRAMANTRPRIMPDKTIVYPRRGTEPPPDVQGYVRAPGDPWKFIPKWGGCDYRVQNQHVKPCGAITIKAFCGHPESPVGQGNEVTLQICESCPLNKCRA